MIKWWKRRWLRAKALSVLQLYYELPLKEPLADLDDLTLHETVNTAFDNGGNEWDAAAGYVYIVVTGIIGSQAEVRGTDLDLVRKAVGMLDTAKWMARPDSLRPLWKIMVERWKAHPDHPANRK